MLPFNSTHGPERAGSLVTNVRSAAKWIWKKLTVVLVIQVVLGYVMLRYFLSYLHTETYIWQCTTLADSLIPTSRSSCPGVKMLSREEVKSFVPKLKIAILMIYDKDYGGTDPTMVPRIINNRENYCKRYGCKVISHITSKEDSKPNANSTASKAVIRPPAWSKLTTMLTHIKSNAYDYVLYLDMDIVIMNPYISLEEIIHRAPLNQDFVMTGDWAGLNTGIMFARNSEFSKWFLQAAWDQEQLVGKYASNGRKIPFNFEQRAFHFMLDTDFWRERKMPTYRGNITELRRHFTVLPQCALNSYLMHPLEPRGDREVSHYVEGDFLIHQAGKKGQIKSDLMKYYLSIAEKGYI
jgi:hypothetical protein